MIQKLIKRPALLALSILCFATLLYAQVARYVGVNRTGLATYTTHGSKVQQVLTVSTTTGDVTFAAGVESPYVYYGPFNTLTAQDTQPIVTGTLYESSQTDTTATTINKFASAANGVTTGLEVGHLLIVKSNAAITFDVTSSTIVGGTTDIVTAAGDVTTFIWDGTSWYVISRMDLSDNLN